jgi:hypothetical protein
MSRWAAVALDSADLDAYNAQVAGSKSEMLGAIKTLRDAYESATGREPSLLQASTSPNAGDVFRSQSEVNAAIRDKRWGNDSAYTADVTAKISRSTY